MRDTSAGPVSILGIVTFVASPFVHELLPVLELMRGVEEDWGGGGGSTLPIVRVI